MTRTYGQSCGLAKAWELVGERWALLVVRDLILGPKRLTELRAGLPRIATSVLAGRLNELEETGVVRRRMLPGLDAGIAYELTEYGRDLEPVVLSMALWGAAGLGEPSAGEAFTLDSALLSLHSTFRPQRAAGVRVSFELRHGPDLTVHAVVDDGQLKVAEGNYAGADLVVEVRGALRALLTGALDPRAAVAQGHVAVTGEPALLEVFTSLFHIPAGPRTAPGLAAR